MGQKLNLFDTHCLHFTSNLYRQCSSQVDTYKEQAVQKEGFLYDIVLAQETHKVEICKWSFYTFHSLFSLTILCVLILEYISSFSFSYMTSNRILKFRTINNIPVNYFFAQLVFHL